nr:MAG TPA: hypothetical protein [Caudoviricetes sp.]
MTCLKCNGNTEKSVFIQLSLDAINRELIKQKETKNKMLNWAEFHSRKNAR